jgi:hypothetical protein
MNSGLVAAETVIRDLRTTSDKIRALARAGYPRTEISKLLEIRYQHVRKVLLDSGITAGLVREVSPPKSPIPVPIASSLRIPPTLLLRSGFVAVGNWVLTPASDIALDGRASAQPGVYVFVVDEEVVYVGLTLRSLHERLNQYRRGDRRQRTNARINLRIKAALANGSKIRVFTAVPESSEWNGLPVNTAAGLEYGLIQALTPKWNIQTGRIRGGACQRLNEEL